MRAFATPAVLCCALAYLLLPGHPLGWLSGAPLGPVGLTLLMLFGLVVFVAWPLQLPRAGCLALLLALLSLGKLGTAAVAPAYGLEASYFVKTGASATPEWSSEFPRLSATRLDRELRFEGAGFPLYFFNDNLRFNYYESDKPDRQTLPFSVLWRGWLQVPTDSEYRFWLTAAGSARLDLAGAGALRIENAGAPQTSERQVRLAAGWHPIEVRYSRVAEAPALLEADWDAGGLRAPVEAPSLLARPTSLPPMLETPLLWVSHLLDLGFAGALALVSALLLRARGRGLSLERTALALLLALVLGYAALSSIELHRQTTILEGGADWLTYETYARDILENGPLMTLGRPIGRGRPYFFQPFYPYALAAFHWLAGEDLYGPVVLQLFGVGVAGVLVYYLGKRLFGPPSGLFALAILLGLLGPLHFDWVARHLLSENIYFWFLPATALALATLADDRRTAGGRRVMGLAIVAGVSLGLCCITRGPTLLWVPAALVVTYFGLRGQTPLPRREGSRTSGPGVVTALVGLTCALVVALVPLRNYVVAGQPSLLATNGVATMELAHPLTPRVNLEGVEKNPVYRALKLDYSIIQFVEFARQDPLGYLATLVPLGLYALGLPGMLEPDAPVRWELLGLVGFYGVYLVGRWKWDDPPGRPPLVRPTRYFSRLGSPTLLLHSFIGLHFLVMMIFLPNVYGYRQVLPMYVFIAVFAGHVIARALARLPRPRRAASQAEDRHSEQRHAVEQYVPLAGAAPRHEELA